MNIRRITSLTAFLSFFVVLLTSVILYIVPHGRVAYWADWRLWTLSKEQWGAIHINTGVLFILSLLLHIYYNWKPIVLYLKNKAKKISVFTPDFNAALIMILACVAGTYFSIPPFSTIIDISDAIKDAAAVKYGEPPYGHAELSSLKTIAKKTDIDLTAGIESLRGAGYRVENEHQTLKEIAENNGVSPQRIYLSMTPVPERSGGVSGKSEKIPEAPAPGTGNRTLADFCSQYDLNITVVMRALKESGIQSKEDMTIKKTAEINNMSAIDVYDRIRGLAEQLYN